MTKSEIRSALAEMGVSRDALKQSTISRKRRKHRRKRIRRAAAKRAKNVGA